MERQAQPGQRLVRPATAGVRRPEPVREGIVAMVGPFIDTIIVCFMTASVILITAENNEVLKRDGSPHIVKGWTDNENSIILYDEMHSWNTKRTLGDKPTPLVYNKKGAKIFHGKYDTNIVNNKMFCLYFKYFFDNEILTKIFDAMEGQITDLEKHSDYKKISNDAFIMGNRYFNITSNEHSPLDVDVRIIKKCTPFFKEWKSWFPLKD